jgi:hypothetical protein
MLRIVRTWVVVGVLVSLTITACGRQAPETATGKNYTTSKPEAGTAIPHASVTFAMRPYADNTFYVIGMKQGWFKDVGIEHKAALLRHLGLEGLVQHRAPAVPEGARS